MRLSQEMDDEIENRLDPANKRTKTRRFVSENMLLGREDEEDD